MTGIPIYLIYEDALPPKLPQHVKVSEKLRAGEEFKKVVNRDLFILVHGSLGIKIQIVKTSMERLRQIADRMGPKIVDEKTIALNPREFPNFLKELDIFLFELYSVFDFFSREVDLVLGPWLNERSDFGRIKKELEIKMPQDEITKRTVQLWESDWFDYFRKLRNRITHRFGVVLSSFIYPSSTILYLPDSPNTYPSKIDKKLEVMPNCQLWLENSLSFMNEITGLLGARVFKNW